MKTILALLLMSTAAQADTTVTIIVTQTQIKTAPAAPRASGGCDWTYPSSCYVPRPIIIERPRRK